MLAFPDSPVPKLIIVVFGTVETKCRTKYKVVYIFKRFGHKQFVGIIFLNTIKVKFISVAGVMGKTKLVPFIVRHIIREAIESEPMSIIDLDFHIRPEEII